MPASLRTRILAWFIGILALATLSSVLVTREVLHLRLEQRIDAELVQETDELRRLAGGNDPATGRRFGEDVGRLFEVFLQRNVPARHEALITILDGRPFLRSRQVVPYRLDADPALIALWGEIDAPVRGRVGTPAGRVEYLAVPVRLNGETSGAFVTAIFRERVGAEADAAVRAAGAIGLAVLLVGSLVAWRLADTVIRPISVLTRTARSISETGLDDRIPVRGNDEVAQLATTFNEMLGRLERAFAAQRRFVDDAGHELRTPLTIVRGHLELIDDDPSEHEATMALVLDELDRMGRIVGDLLLLAKREQPDFLDIAPVELAALTDELHAKVHALAPNDWIVEARASGVLLADRQRLTQAVVQLAENAARHGGEGPVALGSAIRDDEARLWVRDTGPGIAPAEQALIFERFQRGDGRRRADGAGLGLAIVRAIAEAHGGRVELTSTPGRGATFAIVLPLRAHA